VAALTSAAVVLAMAGLGLWAFSAMRDAPMGGMIHRGGPAVTPAVNNAIAARGTAGHAPAS
jgi:hypothetical protein